MVLLCRDFHKESWVSHSDCEVLYLKDNLIPFFQMYIHLKVMPFALYSVHA